MHQGVAIQRLETIKDHFTYIFIYIYTHIYIYHLISDISNANMVKFDSAIDVSKAFAGWAAQEYD